MIRNNKMLALAGGALLLGLMTAAPGEAAPPQVVNKVELRSGSKVVTIEQRFVPTATGTDVQLIARGPVTGTKTAAVMYANGELAVKVDKSWWKSFFSANGLTGDAMLVAHKDNGRTLGGLIVTGAGGSSHYIGVSMIDPDNPWGPCPGPDDAPLCRPEPVVIPFWCKYDVDQCSGGPLPGPWVSAEGIDPDGDPAIQEPDPDGEPAIEEPDPDGSPAVVRGLGLLRLSIDGAKLMANGTAEMGTMSLPIDGSRGFDYRGPGF